MIVAQLNTNRHWGGGEHQVLNLVAGLRREGIDCLLLAHPDGVLLQRAADEGLPVAALPTRGTLDGLRLTLRKTGVELLHAHDSAAVSMATRLGRKAGLPVVVTRRVASPIRGNPWSRRKYSARYLQAVIAISETVRDVFRRTGYPPERIFVVPSGVDIATLEAVRPDDGLRRLYPARHLIVGAGSLTSKKNWSLMVRTAARLRDDGLDAQWLLAGTGPEEAALEAEIAAAGLNRSFHLLGFRREGARLIKSADMLFFPSRMEGASVTVREAMAMGVPVVAARSAGVVESLGGHGWLFGPDDVAEAAGMVNAVLSNDPLREQACRQARQRVRDRFALTGTVRGTIDVYRGVLHAGEGAAGGGAL